MLLIEKRESVYSVYKKGVFLGSLKRRGLSIFHVEKRVSLSSQQNIQRRGIFILPIEKSNSLYSSKLATIVAKSEKAKMKIAPLAKPPNGVLFK